MMEKGHLDQSITEWSEQVVASWLSSLGFSQYEQQLKEHRIGGDVLCRLDLDYLKEIGVYSLGQRLAILKAIYLVKIAHNEPIEQGDYVPPSEADDKQPLTVDRLHDIVKDQNDRLILLEQENRRLQERLQVCFEELGTVQGRKPDEERTLRKQPSMRWAPLKQSARSPTKPVPDDDSPHASPSKPEHDIPPQNPRMNRDQLLERPPGPSRNASSNASTGFASPNGSTPVSRASSSNNRADVSTADSLKTFKVSLEDPTWKVLPAALKKYKIKDEDWRNYAMFICYGTTDKPMTDRCLTYDEKPLLLFQKLKDAKKNPVFMLKHIKDIRSPIAQAQQKQQARLLQRAENANSRDGNGTASSSRPSVSNHPSVRAATMGSRLQALNTPPISTASSGQSTWPETMSPVVEHKNEEGSIPFPRSRLGQSHEDHSEGLAENAKISYAVSIYPYVAEQEDEFDVQLGDTFVVISRAKGWWVVQKDTNGNGMVELEVAKQGWVPAGCLLETSVPIPPTDPSMNAARIPIPPGNIVSTSYPGIALMDYRRKADDELDLYVEDLLRVFKRYNHWSYVVKEDTGERGWVPSWFIGKATPSAGVPPTPNSMNYPGISVANAPVTFSSGDGGSGLNQSPLSNSFQFAGRTSATVL